MDHALTRSAVGVLAALAFALPAAAQVQRAFPQNALRGSITIGVPPEIVLNGEPARLAPGARIRDTENRVVLSAGLTGNRYLVHYTLDTLGLVRDVWILTPAEAARRPWPTTPRQAAEWSFDPGMQTWSRP